MEVKEAIERIKEHKEIHFAKEYPRAIKITEALDMAIKALEKQIPKKVVEINIPNTYYSKAGIRYECPTCHKINYYKETDHCILCGQALDWSEV